MRGPCWPAIGLLAACEAKDAGDGPDTDDPVLSETDSPADSVPPPDSAAPCTPDLEIGTGVTAFLPLADGDPVTIVYGSQGGWHVETAGIPSGLGPSARILSALFDQRTGAQIAGLDETDVASAPLTAYDGCAGTFAGVRAVIDDYLPPEGSLFAYICGLDGAPLRLDVSASDLPDGTPPPFAAVVTRSVEVVGTGDPTFQAVFCDP